ncbi:ABC transporter permease, partial [Rhizobium leguminosarum]
NITARHAGAAVEAIQPAALFQRVVNGPAGLHMHGCNHVLAGSIGTPFTLNSIAAAVLGGVGFLGGKGTMRGAICGSLLLSVMINVMFFL